jgi:hypothetical protein
LLAARTPNLSKKNQKKITITILYLVHSNDRQSYHEHMIIAITCFPAAAKRPKKNYRVSKKLLFCLASSVELR